MKIKQSEAVKAYKSLQDINRQKLSSGKLAKQIYDLFSKLSQAYTFQVQEEQKIFYDHPEFDPSIGGISLENKSAEERKACMTEVRQIEKELKNIADLDFEIDGFDSPIELNLDLESNLKFSGEDIGNLKKLIEFK